MPRTELSSFVGRKLALRQLKELVRTSRLLTLAGVGGVGKTRLARRLASKLEASFRGGYWFVDLASLDQPTLVPRAVSAAVGLRDDAEVPVLQSLAERFRLGPCLLLLDNCEHLLSPVAELATALLEECPTLTIMATSREPLRCAGETVFQVTPLALPTPGDSPSLIDVARSEAAQLFLERATAAAGLRADDSSAIDLATVCTSLDGIPLALELAAGLLRAISLHQLAARSVDAVHLLRGGSRLAPRRQQTLEATIDWSYCLLTEPERRVFEGLSVFAGGISLEAAEAVCASEEIASDVVLPTLAALVDKSLVAAEPTIEPGPRFRLLEPVRQFARTRLDERRASTVREKHAMFFLTLAEQTGQLARAGQAQHCYERLVLEHSNVRLALLYFEARDSERLLRLTAALWFFWYRSGLYHEGAAWLEKALASDVQGMARERAAATCGLAELRWPTGRFEDLEQLSLESLKLAREAGDAWLEAFSLYHLAIPPARADDTVAAVALAEQSAALARTTGDPWLTTYMVSSLGVCLMRGGDLTRARTLFEEALSLSRTAGDELIGAYQLSCLGAVARLENDLDNAGALWSQSLTIAVRIGDWRLAALQLLKLADVAFRDKRRLQAARLLGAGEALLERLRVAYEFPLSELDPLRTAASFGPLAAAREKGRSMPVNKVIAEVLEQPRNPPTSRTHGPLTPREAEIAALVTEGWSNREIAARLVITERTAENHVSHILDKLQVSTRTQLASRYSLSQ